MTTPTFENHAWKLPFRDLTRALVNGNPNQQRLLLRDMRPDLVSTPTHAVPEPPVPPKRKLEQAMWQMVNHRRQTFDLVSLAIHEDWVRMIHRASLAGEAVPEENLRIARESELWAELEKERKLKLELGHTKPGEDLFRNAKATLANRLQMLGKLEDLTTEDRAALVTSTRLLGKLGEAGPIEYRGEASALAEAMTLVLKKMGIDMAPPQPAAAPQPRDPGGSFSP